jgi:Helix-turn-helix of DDE superfamily endonuclease
MFDKYGFLEKHPTRCQRVFGLKFKELSILLKKIQFQVDQYLARNPLANRGLEAEFSLENQLLLTLEYLKSAPTFEVLGFSYGISESYAYKCYHAILPLLSEVSGVSDPQQLRYQDVQKMIAELNHSAEQHLYQQPIAAGSNTSVITQHTTTP